MKDCRHWLFSHTTEPSTSFPSGWDVVQVKLWVPVCFECKRDRASQIGNSFDGQRVTRMETADSWVRSLCGCPCQSYFAAQVPSLSAGGEPRKCPGGCRLMKDCRHWLFFRTVQTQARHFLWARRGSEWSCDFQSGLGARETER